MTIRQRVEGRAGGRCEYCRAPQSIGAYTFHIEHVTPRAKGGKNVADNYAFSCLPCNTYKGAHIAGIDPESGSTESLFNPREQKWGEHFKFSTDLLEVQGFTPVGRATVTRLKMNSGLRAEARKLWLEAGAWP